MISAASLDELISRTRISDVVVALGGPRPQRGRCPAWYRGGDNPESVSLDDARGLWKDFVNGRGGGILDLIETARGCSRTEAVAWLASYHGVTLVDRQRRCRPPWRISTATGPTVAQESRRSDVAGRIKAALAIWGETTELSGTLGETYLLGRGLAVDGLDHVVRFHPGCPWGGGERVSAVVSLLRDIVTDEPCGVHRVGLDAGGAKLGKKMLGRAKGAAVKLSPDDAVTMGLGICEGVETGLAILQAGWAPVWAALFAGGVESFPVLRGIEGCTVFADADGIGLLKADVCAERWSQMGIGTWRRAPAADGADFNDLGVTR